MRDQILLRIKNLMWDFTPVERVIAAYFNEHNIALPIHELSDKLNVSPASISRFVKKLGLNNYKEFIYCYEKEQAVETKSPLYNVVSQYSSVLEAAVLHYQEETVHQICELMANKRVINAFGRGFNKYTTYDMAFRYQNIGKLVNVIEDINLLKVHASLVQPDEVIFILTLRGIHASLIDILQTYKQKHIDVVLITSNEKSELIPFATQTLFTGVAATRYTCANISPQLPMLIQLDIIFDTYLQLHQDLVSRWKNTEDILKK